MRWSHAVTAAVLGTGLVGSVAQASLTVSLVQVPISAAAKTADSALNNARSFDLMVTQSGGEKWNVSVLQFSLASGGGFTGSFYNTSPSSNIVVNNPPVGGENVGFDTAFTSPRYGQTSDGSHIDILGNSDYPSAAGAGATPSTGPQLMSVAWGDHQGTSDPAGDGTYKIARLTVTGNTGAYIDGYSAGNINANNAQTFHNLYLPILGDTSGDGRVNITDLNNVENHFGSATSIGDTNADGNITIADLNAVENNFGLQLLPPPGSALGSLVPEPSCLALLGITGILLGRRGRRLGN
jgi:hypothetical protein